MKENNTKTSRKKDKSKSEWRGSVLCLPWNPLLLLSMSAKSSPLKDKWRMWTISIAFPWDCCVYETKAQHSLRQSASHAEHISNNGDKEKCTMHQFLRLEAHWMQNTKNPISIYSPFLNQFCRASNLQLRMVSQWPVSSRTRIAINIPSHLIFMTATPKMSFSDAYGLFRFLSMYSAILQASEDDWKWF